MVAGSFVVFKPHQVKVLFLFILTFHTTQVARSGYKIQYMDDYCSWSRDKGTLYLNGTDHGFIIRPSRFIHLPQNFPRNCTLQLRTLAAKKYDFIISFLFVDLKEGPFERCIIDYLQVKAEDFSQRFCHVDYSESEKTSVIFNDQSQLELFLRAGSSVSMDGFEIVLTLGNPGGSCSDPEDYHCENGQCIPKQFLCDRRNNCGDRSDESEFQCDKSPRTALIATLVPLMLIIVGAAVFALHYCYKSKGGFAELRLRLRTTLKARRNTTHTVVCPNTPQRRAPPPPIQHLHLPKPRQAMAGIANPSFNFQPRPCAPPPPPRKPRY